MTVPQMPKSEEGTAKIREALADKFLNDKDDGVQNVLISITLSRKVGQLHLKVTNITIEALLCCIILR